MTGISNLPELNDHGDNGWWKAPGSTMAHYFIKKRPTCGIDLIRLHGKNVARKNAYDKRCRNCMKVRRNQLIIRMNKASLEMINEEVDLLFPISHSPRKPQ